MNSTGTGPGPGPSPSAGPVSGAEHIEHDSAVANPTNSCNYRSASPSDQYYYGKD